MSWEIVKLTRDLVGQILEKPWVILPGQTSNVANSLDSVAEDQTPPKNLEVELATALADHTLPLTRWNSVNNALFQYAEKVGKDDTYIGQYLSSLAALSFPASHDNNNPASPTRPHGIFDVVITAGQGAKDMPSQGTIIEQPTTMRLEKIKEPKAAQIITRKYAPQLSRPLQGLATASSLHPAAFSSAQTPQNTQCAAKGTLASPDDGSSPVGSGSDIAPRQPGKLRFSALVPLTYPILSGLTPSAFMH